MRRVVELFAGVGGFRVGLNNVRIINNKVYESKNFKIVFFNQWEPSRKVQHAYNCYINNFNDENISEFSNCDITKIDKKLIPDHDLLVGGFPCQDYSVARSLSGEKGIEGKKGVLWWEIYKTIEEKKPNFVLLENVDRILISPSKFKGRDFSIILKCFDDLGYYVEWKVINAADYGMPQKRKRIFIFACKKTTNYFSELSKNFNDNIIEFIEKNKSFFTTIFNTKVITNSLDIKLDKNVEEISKNYSCPSYYDTGIMFNSVVYTFKTAPNFNGQKVTLKDIIQDLKEISNDFIIDDNLKLEKFKYLKSRKKIKREKNGFKYTYSEGQMSFPENLDLPARTMLTSEGSLNRSTHVIKQKNIYRFLTPIECERLNMFPDDWTNIDGLSPRTRNFLMGNALVCGIIEKLSKKLAKLIDMEKQ